MGRNWLAPGFSSTIRASPPIFGLTCRSFAITLARASSLETTFAHETAVSSIRAFSIGSQLGPASKAPIRARKFRLMW